MIAYSPIVMKWIGEISFTMLLPPLSRMSLRFSVWCEYIALQNCTTMYDHICQRHTIVSVDKFRVNFERLLLLIWCCSRQTIHCDELWIVTMTESYGRFYCVRGGVYTHDLITWNDGHQINNISCLLMSKASCRLICDCLVFDVFVEKLDEMEWNKFKRNKTNCQCCGISANCDGFSFRIEACMYCNSSQWLFLSEKKICKPLCDFMAYDYLSNKFKLPLNHIYYLYWIYFILPIKCSGTPIGLRLDEMQFDIKSYEMKWVNVLQRKRRQQKDKYRETNSKSPLKIEKLGSN